MQRYFLSAEQITTDRAFVIGGDYHHMRHVMRMKPGEKIIINAPDGTAFFGILRGYTEDTAEVELGEKLTFSATLQVTIAQALIKKDAFELMVEKATEFGAAAIIPTMFSRSIVKIEDEETARKKVLRYQSIAKEAAEQCHRPLVPDIAYPVKLQSLPYADFDQIWVCYEASTREETLAVAIASAAVTDRILIMIGPEGGIDPAELTFLKAKGARIVDLGPRILRSETASLYVLSVLSYLWGR